ncbi:hypothetical protein [Crucivirus-527]|nr:hypothetical protein [Crucivirus-527]QMW69023.1 hypothetical protein [Crucivirus-528]
MPKRYRRNRKYVPQYPQKKIWNYTIKTKKRRYYRPSKRSYPYKYQSIAKPRKLFQKNIRSYYSKSNRRTRTSGYFNNSLAPFRKWNDPIRPKKPQLSNLDYTNKMAEFSNWKNPQNPSQRLSYSTRLSEKIKEQQMKAKAHKSIYGTTDWLTHKSNPEFIYGSEAPALESWQYPSNTSYFKPKKVKSSNVNNLLSKINKFSTTPKHRGLRSQKSMNTIQKSPSQRFNQFF